MIGKRALMPLLSAFSTFACASAPVATPVATVDHLVVGVADLAVAIDDFERASGVRPVVGGEHPGRGTHNALISLGGPSYLELIAVQPGAQAPDYEALRYLTKPTPILWAVGVTEVAAAKSRLAAAGFESAAPEPGSRRTPAGSLLEWETFRLSDNLDGAPFFIRWLPGTPHPASTSPGGCRLARFEIATPDPAPLTRLVQALDLEAVLVPGERTVLKVTLECPRGEVVLSP